VFFVPVVIFRVGENESDIQSLPVVMDRRDHPEIIPAHVKYGIGCNVVGRVKCPPHIIKVQDTRYKIQGARGKRKEERGKRKGKNCPGQPDRW